MAYSIDNKTALLYGLFSWQQNGLIVWLIQLTTERPYYMAYSVGNKMALLYGLFSWRQTGLKWRYYMAYSIDNKTAFFYGFFN